MKSLFTVGANLVGVVLLYKAAESLFYLIVLFRADESDWWRNITESLFIEQFFLHLIFGLLLAFKSDWVIRMIKLQNGKQPLHLTMDSRRLLSVGIRLVGLFLMVGKLTGIYQFITLLIGSFYPVNVLNSLKVALMIWIYLLPFYLIFGWRRITDILDRPAKEKKTQEAVVET